MKFFSFFFPNEITEVNSPINGKIEVIEQFGKKSIRVEGLEQSGPMVEKIWEKGLTKTPQTPQILKTSNCLILGLGGGSVVKLIDKHFPKARILGIEIDPMMIELGKKYLNLSEYKNLEIKITDAFKWVQKSGGLNNQTIFDLILVDLYLGRGIPEKIEDDQFLKNLKGLLTKKGIVIFNRLRGQGEGKELEQFLNKLKKSYPHIEIIKPLVNYLIICSFK